MFIKIILREKFFIEIKIFIAFATMLAKYDKNHSAVDELASYDTSMMKSRLRFHNLYIIHNIAKNLRVKTIYEKVMKTLGKSHENFRDTLKQI